MAAHQPMGAGMISFLKLLAGLFAILVLTYAGFYVMRRGEWTINDLTRKANEALVTQNIIGVTVAFEVAPMRRVAHLDGDIPAAQQAHALEIVRAEPGVADATWGGGTAPASTGSGAE